MGNRETWLAFFHCENCHNNWEQDIPNGYKVVLDEGSFFSERRLGYTADYGRFLRIKDDALIICPKCKCRSEVYQQKREEIQCNKTIQIVPA